jgi:hypothetical protein
MDDLLVCSVILVGSFPILLTSPHTKPASSLQSCSKSKLVRQTNRHLRMLKHMSIAHSAERILSSMDIPAGIGKSTLDDESRRVSRLRSTRVVRASIPTLCLDIRNCAVLDTN